MDHLMRKLPIGIQTFEKIREGNYLYVGKKELFKGLAIEKLETEWNTYPVFHFDLNAKKYDKIEDLYAILNQYMEPWEDIYGNEKKERSPEERLSYLIKQAYEQTGKEVVVLVDEYDKPLLQAIENEELLEEFCLTLKAFYGVLKSSDRYLRFAFLTGRRVITKPSSPA